MTKAEIRAATLQKRDALDADFRREESARLMRQVMELPVFREAKTVLAYASFGSEPETTLLLEGALAAGKRLVLPRINRETKALELFHVTDLSVDLAPGVWNIREPRIDRCATCATEEIEFALVPGVAFDRGGGRIGYGRGFYDKLLAAVSAGGNRPYLAAAAFEGQMVDEVPMEPHDVRLDIVIR